MRGRRVNGITTWCEHLGIPNGHRPQTGEEAALELEVIDLRDEAHRQRRQIEELQRVYDERGRQIERLEKKTAYQSSEVARLWDIIENMDFADIGDKPKRGAP